MSQGVIKAGLMLFLISAGSKILGFIREMLIANYYGTSHYADAYYVALTPSTLAMTFSIAIGSVFLPLFIKHLSDKEKSFLFSNNVLTLFFISFVVFYLLMVLFPDYFINFLAPGLSPNAESISILLLNILFPLVFIVIAIQIYTLMLNTFNDYVKSAATVIPNNLIIILYIYIFGDEFGISGVAIATLVASVIQLVILYILLKKHDYKVINNTEIWGKNSKEFLLLLLPIIVSSAFSQLNSVIDRILASNISEGAIASLLYAFRLRGIATGIFITPIVTLTFPKLAKHSNNENEVEVSNLTHKSLFVVFLLLAPLTLIFIIFNKEIIQILFERGNFDSRATEMTSSVFLGYAIGILAIGFREVALRAFYSYGDTKTPAYIMIIGSIINAILSFLLVKKLGLLGLGLSSSISFIIISIIIAVLLKKSMKTIWSPAFIRQVLKIVVATGVVGGLVFYMKYLNVISFLLVDNYYLKFIALSIYSILTYLIFIALLVMLREKEILNLIRTKLVKKLKG